MLKTAVRPVKKQRSCDEGVAWAGDSFKKIHSEDSLEYSNCTLKNSAKSF